MKTLIQYLALIFVIPLNSWARPAQPGDRNCNPRSPGIEKYLKQASGCRILRDNVKSKESLVEIRCAILSNSNPDPNIWLERLFMTREKYVQMVLDARGDGRELQKWILDHLRKYYADGQCTSAYDIDDETADKKIKLITDDDSKNIK